VFSHLWSLKEGWRFVIYFRSMECCWGSGFGVMFVREMPYRRLLGILNMVACGVGGVLIMFMGHMGWVLEEYIFFNFFISNRDIIKSVRYPQVHRKHTRENTYLEEEKRTRKS
jgi:hypothetical protein